MLPYITISRPLIARCIIFLASVASTSPIVFRMASAEAEIITLCDKNHAPLPKYINPEYVCKESSISLATVMFKYLHERDNAGDKANETLASRNNGLPKIIGVAGG